MHPGQSADKRKRLTRISSLQWGQIQLALRRLFRLDLIMGLPPVTIARSLPTLSAQIQRCLLAELGSVWCWRSNRASSGAGAQRSGRRSPATNPSGARVRAAMSCARSSVPVVRLHGSRSHIQLLDVFCTDMDYLVDVLERTFNQQELGIGHEGTVFLV